MIVTHHNFDFGIDTADWSNEDSAAKAASKLEDWLLSLGDVETATLHAALREHASTGETTGLMQAAWDAGNRACLEVWTEEEWAEMPNSGHNCDLYAA